MTYIEGYGTTTSLIESWDSSQIWESNIWEATNAEQDRVDQHMHWFDNYEALRVLIKDGHRLGNVVEIGCGPFTQSIPLLKLMGTDSLDSLTLVDPLIDVYLRKVRHVPYRDVSRNMFGKPTNLVRIGAEEAGYLLQREYFDTVIMLNVIEHGKSAPKILQTLWQLLRLGGVLVFHEYNYEDRGFFVDTGHPIKLWGSFFEFLLRHFDQVYRKDFNHEGDYSHTYHGSLFYWVETNLGHSEVVKPNLDHSNRRCKGFLSRSSGLFPSCQSLYICLGEWTTLILTVASILSELNNFGDLKLNRPFNYQQTAWISIR